MKQRICALFIVLTILLVKTISAETISLSPQTSDAEVWPSAIYDSVTARVGETTTGGYGRAAVYVFTFPKIAFAEKIIGASFTANLSSDLGSFSFNGDLYSLGVSSSPYPLATDYFNGAYGTSPDAVGIQQHFVTPATPLGVVSTTSSGGSALASDLDVFRAAGTSPGAYYFLRVNSDLTSLSASYLGYNLSMANDTSHPPSLTVTTGAHPQQGRILCEYWSNIFGNDVSSLTSSPQYPAKPTSREYPTLLEIPQNMDTNSGTRMRGIYFPPATGNYTFAVASDDNSQLILSTDSTPANGVVIASVTGLTGYRQWTKYPSQVSTAIPLQAGKGYYLEVLHKQDTSTSNLSVGFMPPGASSISVMPATNVAPYDVGAAYASGAITNALTQGHPRLILSPAAVARLKASIAVTGSVPATWWTTIQAQANTILSEGLIVPPAAPTALLAPARTLQDRVYYLGLLYQMSSDTGVRTNCLNKIYAELQAGVNWGGGADNDTAPGNWNAHSFLDVPEIVHAYAIAYDWFYDGWTPTQRTFILNAIANQGLALGITAYGPPMQSYLDSGSNWTIVCDTGLCLGALAILGDETTSPKAPTILDDFMPTLFSSPAMAEWGPDGAWPEGECYWNYSARYLSTFLASLETSAATCYTFDRLSGISSAGSFEMYEFGPLFRSFNYSDENNDGLASDQGRAPGMQYLALKYNQPVYSWNQQQVALPYPTDLIWYDPRGSTATPTSFSLPTSTYYRNTGIILLRSAWNDPNALFAGMKAGFNTDVTPYGSGHEELEIGTFVFDALGVRWAQDLGRDNYNLGGYWHDYPDDTPDRWQYYRCRAEGNNTLVINPSADGGQCRAANAPITSFTSTSTLQQAIIDMTSAYSATTGHNGEPNGDPTSVTGAKRGIRMINGTAQIQDEVTASAAMNLNWFMHTATTVTLSGDHKTATLTPSTGTSRLEMLIQSPSTATFSTMAAVPLAGSPNPAGQATNSGFTKLRIQLSGATSATITVAMCPYIQGNTPPAAPPVTPLANW